MSKLNTLKDIELKFTPWNSSDKEVEVHVNIEPDGFATIVLPKNIRDVARGWVDKYTDKLSENTFQSRDWQDAKIKIDWIKYFFNLEDDKNE